MGLEQEGLHPAAGVSDQEKPPAPRALHGHSASHDTATVLERPASPS